MIDHNSEHRFVINRRILILAIIKIACLLFLITRLFSMQIFHRRRYKQLADKNKEYTMILPAKRGKILDLNGNIIAYNEVVLSLILDKTQKTYFTEFKRFANEISLDQDYQSLEQNILSSKNQQYVLIKELSWKQIAAIEEVIGAYNSLSIKTDYRRMYRVHNNMSHIIGYVNQVGGVSGIEKYYNNLLSGKAGYKKLEVNALGKYIKTIIEEKAQDAKNIKLNIDTKLQQMICDKIQYSKCCLTIMNYKNGNIISMISKPDFDSNRVIKGEYKYWQNIINDPEKPLLNRNIHSVYPPGSLFKIITILAALEYGIDPEHKVLCNNRSFFLNYKGFRCASRTGHGGKKMINMIDAIKFSCNHYIYYVANILGPHRIINMASRFGFGQNQLIDLPGAVKGFLPTPKWKKNKFGIDWSIGDTLNLSIGQGFTLTTPMHLLGMISAIANKGYMVKPKIIADVADNSTYNIGININHIKIIQQGMQKAVNERGGTAFLSSLERRGMNLHGKTGTVQLVSKNFSDQKQSVFYKKENAIFGGYIEYKNKHYAIIVHLEGAGAGSTIAAPTAASIISEVLNFNM